MNIKNNEEDKFFDLNRTLQLITSKWYLILIVSIIFLCISFVVNRYSQAVYQVASTVQVNKNNTNSTLSLLYGDIASPRINLVDETILLKSFPLIASTLSELNFGVSYFFGNRLYPTELYKNSPIKLKILPNSVKVPYNEYWECKAEDNKTFTLTTSSGSIRNIYFGDSVNIDGFNFSIELLKPETILSYEKIIFRINNLYDNVQYYNKNLRVNPAADQSSIINLSINSKTPEKAIDFLNKLTQKIIENNIDEKKSNSINSVSFIDKQLQISSNNLQTIEQELRTYKAENATIDLGKEGSHLYESIQNLENEKASYELQNEYFHYLIQSLNRESEIEKIAVPSSLGVQDPILNQLIETLVNAQIEIKFLINDRKQKNPLVQDKRMLIQELKQNILTNVNNQKANNDIKLKEIDKRINRYETSLKRLPYAEQQLVNIQREYKLNESLYLLLMEKKMEAGVSGAAVSPEYKIVNKAYNQGIVSSSPVKNYIVAIILGLFLPIAILTIKAFFDNRIHTKEELKQLSPFPILGSVVHLDEKNVNEDQRYVLFESFRTIRANLRYLTGRKNTSEVLLFTSATSGEGKTFCSKNLSYLLAKADKRVLWIDADMRKPYSSKEHHDSNKSYNRNGLSNYLAGFCEIDNIVNKTDLSNYMTIEAGEMPPNPSELLIGSKMELLIETLKLNFDYIIIDTPPLGLISDALELLPITNYILLVARQKYSRIPAYAQMQEMLISKGIKEIAIILNDVKRTSQNYGYNYGYSYSKKELSI